METSVYTYDRTYVKKDGTVTVYKTAKKYQKKRAVVHKPTLELIKKINNPEQLEQINNLIKTFLKDNANNE
jgi:hypothetical protein